jgi:ABC-type transporter Mla maintaining outer membrane lipid asymmetry permease subunit MlaE
VPVDVAAARQASTQCLKGDCIMSGMSRSLRVLACLGLIAAFTGCAATPTRESTGQYVDDSVITTKVKAVILEDDSLKSLQISVKTFKGVVQLSGFVDSARSVNRAGELAGTVEGVRSVKNDLLVK